MPGEQQNAGQPAPNPSADAAGKAGESPAGQQQNGSKEPSSAFAGTHAAPSRQQVLDSLPQAIREVVEPHMRHSEKEFNDKVSAVLGEKLGAIPVEDRDPERFRHLKQQANEAEGMRKRIAELEGQLSSRSQGQQGRAGGSEEKGETDLLEANRDRITKVVEAKVKRAMEEFSIQDPEKRTAQEKYLRRLYTDQAEMQLELAVPITTKKVTEDEYRATYYDEVDEVGRDPEWLSDLDSHAVDRFKARVLEAILAGKKVSPKKEWAEAKAFVASRQAKGGGGTDPSKEPKKEPAKAPAKEPEQDMGERVSGGPTDVRPDKKMSLREKTLSSKGARDLDAARGIRR